MSCTTIDVYDFSNELKKKIAEHKRNLTSVLEWLKVESSVRPSDELRGLGDDAFIDALGQTNVFCGVIYLDEPPLTLSDMMKILGIGWSTAQGQSRRGTREWFAIRTGYPIIVW